MRPPTAAPTTRDAPCVTASARSAAGGDYMKLRAAATRRAAGRGSEGMGLPDLAKIQRRTDRCDK